ncbi:interleukin-2 receptor subunit alpha isoform X2 [Choloepus didactylus]|uniref:interleukin-2 receptor subunit alpha isoform X2 n=1 Tax=Choloepus didactylus TaxID=27675 RepID=UPI00189DCC78|nr:interleukin-2 receptor subunit alpha isoform X2 [Choloepus didactylus]
MEPSPLVWGLFTLLVTGCVAEFCEDDPPKVRNAQFKAHTYQNGTILNCECKRGFRRSRNGLPFMLCVGNSSYSSWENKCQCISISSRNKGKHATPKPEEQKERNTTDVQSQMQPVDQVNLLGPCREPPPWEHEAMERIYHFMVGQTVYYQCLKGYRALQKGPAKSICKMHCGKTRWTRPRLTCTKEEEYGLLPGKEQPESSTEPLSDSATSCLLITTDLQEHTELVTTMETFVFTTEYQIAVAGCIFLLISILLLSGLTWQWKWRKSRRTI